MTTKRHQKNYNDRLFSGNNWRSWYHLSRFKYLKRTVKYSKLLCESVFELGCFDGKSLQYLPTSPTRYVGIDADWEGGLSSFQSKYSTNIDLKLLKSTSPDDLNSLDSNTFDLVICMETLEHINAIDMPEYIDHLYRVCKPKGLCVITIPNEKGIPFLLKYLVKFLLEPRERQEYSFKEVFYAFFGKMKNVKRNEHKGFDYADCVRHFRALSMNISLESIPLRLLPLNISPTVGIKIIKS